MKSEMGIDIERSIAEVFEFTTTRCEEWSSMVVEDELTSAPPMGVGSTFRTVTEDRGRRMEFQGTVTRHEPPTVHEVRMKGEQFEIVALYTFEDQGGSTRVTQQSTVTGKGLIRVMFMLFGSMMRKSSCDALEKELQQLKKMLESPDSSSPDPLG